MRFTRVLPPTAAFLLTALVACGGSEPAGPVGPGSHDTIEYVLGARTKQLTAEDLAGLQAGADTSQTLRFTRAVGAKFARGDVLLANTSDKTPRGLLRIVTKTTTVGDVVELETDLPPLQLAFQKLKVHVETTLDVPLQNPSPITPKLGFPVGGVVTKDEFIFDGDGDPATLEDQLHVNDRFEGQLGVTLDIDFDWGFAEALTSGVDDFLECTVSVATLGLVGDCPDLDLPELKATFAAKAVLATELDHEGAASAGFGTKKFEIGETQVITPGIPIGPLTIFPEVGFRGEMKGKAGSYSRMKGNSQVGFDVSLTASTASGISTSTPSPSPSFEVSEVSAYLDGHVTTSVGPHIDMLLYGAIGPTFGLAFRSDLDVDRTRVEDCYRASIALDADFGFKVKLPWRALGTAIGGSTEVGEKVEWVASKFGLDKTLVDESIPFTVSEKQVGQGPCTIPPPGMLPPGAPQDDTLANPPFVQWAKRHDEPGTYFEYSASPHEARTHLVLGVDGHLWAASSPSPTLRRIAIDGRKLSAVRYLAPVPEEDNREKPLIVSDLIERQDLAKWVLFENGVVGRLGADNALVDAFSITVPVADQERAFLRRGAVRPDGRTALVFGIRQIQNDYDHRMVLVELDTDGVILRARQLGPATDPGIQHAFYTVGQIFYRADGSLVVGADRVASADATAACALLAVRDDGSLAFANTLSPGGATCNFGGMAASDNGDLLITGNDGRIFQNQAYSIVLDADGNAKTSASFQLGGQDLLLPTFISRVSTSGYLVVGSSTQSANQDGQFVVRLDAQGVPLSAATYRPPSGVQLGFLDAYVTKDAGVLFASLADWKDLAEQRDLTRFFVGKAYAKDGSLPFAAGSGMTTITPELSGNVLPTTVAPSGDTFADVAVTFVPKTVLRAEALESPETVFAP